MADYGTLLHQAESIYNPQFDQENLSLGQGIASARQALDTEGKTLDTDYNNSLYDYGQQQKNEAAKNDFTASTHGLFGSGLAANQQNMTYGDYQTNVSRLNQARADKLADIAGRRQLAESAYSQNSTALFNKYQGLKGQYINQGGEQQAAIDRENALLQAQYRAAF